MRVRVPLPVRSRAEGRNQRVEVEIRREKGEGRREMVEGRGKREGGRGGESPRLTTGERHYSSLPRCKKPDQTADQIQSISIAEFPISADSRFRPIPDFARCTTDH